MDDLEHATEFLQRLRENMQCELSHARQQAKLDALKQKIANKTFHVLSDDLQKRQQAAEKIAQKYLDLEKNLQ